MQHSLTCALTPLLLIDCIICSLHVGYYYEKNILLFLGFLIDGQEVSNRYSYYTYAKALVLSELWPLFFNIEVAVNKSLWFPE